MKRIIPFILVAIVISGQAFGQNDKKVVLETVTKRGIEAKLKFLASDEMRGRQTPSPELNTAAKYLESRLYENGVEMAPGMDSYLQPVQMVSTNPPSGGGLSLGDSLFSFSKEMLLMSGVEGDYSGPIAYLNFGSEADFKDADVKGKIVIVKAGTEENPGARAAFSAGKEKVAMASKAGAKALIELYVSPQPNWKLLRYYLGSSQIGLASDEDEALDVFPRIWLDDVSGSKRELLTTFEGEAKLTVEGAQDEHFVTYNVVGIVPGTDKALKDEYLMFSAHYDHVGVGEVNAQGDSIFNGTRDNAIGTVAVMEAMKNISKYPLKRSAMFVFFTGEEKGLLGSEWYVNHPVIPLEQTVMCYNCDNGGYNDTTFAMCVGLERVTTEESMGTACEAFGLELKPDQVLDQNLYARSDHYSFANKGVPGVMYGMAATAFDEEINNYLHQQADNPNTVDYNYLYKFMSSYVYGGRLIGNAKDRPYWTKGDDFYEGGETLYK